MWILGLALALPLLFGVCVTGKRFHGFLKRRGMESKQAVTTAIISMVLLVGLMASPWILPFGALRVAVWVFYFYFLYVGTKSIVNFFFGSDEVKPEAPKPSHDDDHDCGCDHSGHDHTHGPSNTVKPEPKPEANDAAKKDGEDDGEQSNWDKFRPKSRDPRDIRDDLQRRRNQQ